METILQWASVGAVFAFIVGWIVMVFRAPKPLPEDQRPRSSINGLPNN